MIRLNKMRHWIVLSRSDWYGNRGRKTFLKLLKTFHNKNIFFNFSPTSSHLHSLQVEIAAFSG